MASNPATTICSGTVDAIEKNPVAVADLQSAQSHAAAAGLQRVQPIEAGGDLGAILRDNHRFRGPISRIPWRSWLLGGEDFFRIAPKINKIPPSPTFRVPVARKPASESVSRRHGV